MFQHLAAAISNSFFSAAQFGRCSETGSAVSWVGFFFFLITGILQCNFLISDGFLFLSWWISVIVYIFICFYQCDIYLFCLSFLFTANYLCSFSFIFVIDYKHRNKTFFCWPNFLHASLQHGSRIYCDWWSVDQCGHQTVHLYLTLYLTWQCIFT